MPRATCDSDAWVWCLESVSREGSVWQDCELYAISSKVASVVRNDWVDQHGNC